MPRTSFAATTRHGGMVAVILTAFVLGLAAGAVLKPSLAPSASASVEPAPGEASAGGEAPARPDVSRAAGFLAYPADVIRVIDGDTFEANVHIWPGLNVDTKVRLRDVDAPELHARCADEYAKAEAARGALTKILAEGGVAVSRVGIDKYGGRVDASVATRSTADVSAALLSGGFARAYDGGRRGSWCG
jgi:endonuclease YncB( thermonuclease family)